MNCGDNLGVAGRLKGMGGEMPVSSDVIQACVAPAEPGSPGLLIYKTQRKIAALLGPV